MPLQATSGAASYDAFGGGVAAVPNYIEECFATHLYTGNGSTQTINNGIDLAGKGGLVWVKRRSGVQFHILQDTVRGAGQLLYSNDTSGQGLDPASATTFSSTGFTTGSDNNVNASGSTYASWTFREQPKFFDVVTYTGNSTAGRTIAHNLGSVPGCIIVKCTSAGSTSWYVYHRALNATKNLFLNTTAAAQTETSIWNDTEPTSTVFTVGGNDNVNEAGQTFVAYLFAHNAGGFGLTGTDNVISCGSYNGTGSTTGFDVTLGYEPQWVLVKRASGGTGNWTIVDNMRGFAVTAPNKGLTPNTADAEYNINSSNPIIAPTATGFRIADTTNADWNSSSSTYIYIAIRRGPMKVPTTGTSVFAPSIANGATRPGFVTDLQLANIRAGDTFNTQTVDRLRGGTLGSVTSSTAAEYTGGNQGFDTNNGTNYSLWTSGAVRYMFQRAPGFFDEVCYTGTGSARTINHNLTVAPELIIFKSRSLAGEHWGVWVPAFGFSSGILRLSTTDAVLPLSDRITGISATTVSVGTNGEINNSGSTYVMYLFASCPGVSKVGSFTGTGTTQVINCGFTGGARFVLIKSTSTTGNWLVWDSARGIVAGNDPYLALNSTAAEVTNTDWVDTAATGFELSNAGGNLANSNGVSYIFLAIA